MDNEKKPKNAKQLTIKDIANAKPITSKLSSSYDSYYKFTNTISALKDLRGNLQQIVEAQDRMDRVAKGLVSKGMIKHEESVHSLLKSTMYFYNQNTSIIKQIQQHDTLLDLAKSIDKVKFSATGILNQEFIKSIFDRMDNNDLFKVISEHVDEDIEHMEQNIEVEEDQEPVNIVNPQAFQAASNINIVINVNNYYYDSPDAKEEDKTLWEKVLRPILLVIMRFFLMWSFWNFPIADANIFKQLEELSEIISEYQFPYETTDLEMKEEMEANKKSDL